MPTCNQEAAYCPDHDASDRAASAFSDRFGEFEATLNALGIDKDMLEEWIRAKI